MVAEADVTIDLLVEAGKLEEAAQRCEREGALARASELYERACDFAAAASSALGAGDVARAARLAVLGVDPEVMRRVRAALAEDAVLAASVAEELAARGQPLAAARIHADQGDHERAALAYERAGETLEAARAHARAGKPAPAARAYESLLRAAATGVDLDEVRIELGALYALHGKHEAAIRVLQRLPQGAASRAQGVALLVTSLKAVGLTDAALELEAELRDHGGAPSPDGSLAVRGAEEAAPGEAEGAVLYGRYQLIDEVANTPHARVLEAIDRVTSERVAVKVFAARVRGTGRDALDRFVREARALSQLRHPNVLPLRAFVPDGPAMVLAWMPGGSLRDLLDAGPVSPARAAEIAGCTLSALAEAHRLGILHRDVKPTNLLFDDGGTPKLADFGAAHMSDADVTVTAGAIGTVGYMAPEQRAGRPASVRSDLYSVGVLLYEMLMGEQSDDIVAERLQGVHPELTPEHEAVVARLCEPRQAERFDDALAARRAIEAVAWPTRLAPPRAPGKGAPSRRPRDDRAADPDARLTAAVVRGHVADAGRRQHDRWLERDVLVLPLEDERVRGAAFARAGSPALATVLRVDVGAGQLWVSPPRGSALGELRAVLTSEEHAILAGALERLHAAGGVHGSIDADHVYRYAGAVCLAYPRRPAGSATAVTDRLALRRLAGSE